MSDTSRLGLTGSDKVWVYTIAAGGGLLVGLFTPALADLLHNVPFIPFKSVLEWVGDLNQGWAWIVRPVGGLTLGVIAGLVIIHDEYALQVGDDEIVILHGDNRRHLARDMVVGVHRDRKHIVIDGEHGRVLFDKSVEASRQKVEEAFTRHGYPWEG